MRKIPLRHILQPLNWTWLWIQNDSEDSSSNKGRDSSNEFPEIENTADDDQSNVD